MKANFQTLFRFRSCFCVALCLFLFLAGDVLGQVAGPTVAPPETGEGAAQIANVRQLVTDWAFQIAVVLLVFGGIMWFFNRPAFTIGALVAAAVIYGGPHLAQALKNVAR
jgi:type IV secretory pathway VirB2 component (pilin)